MIDIKTDGAVFRNTATETGAPAARIAGDNVRFTNADSGRLVAGSSGSPALLIEGVGATVVNELGGVIRADDFDGDYLPDEVAILGSAFADTIVNEGLIAGTVRLGGGNDSYTERTQSAPGPVDLGAGNDTYWFEAEWLPTVTGGSGTDRIVLDGDVSQVWGETITGFERLDIGGGDNFVNVENFSGFSQIVLQGGATNFLSSANPLGDVTMSGGRLIVGAGSTFDDITGSVASEQIEVATNAYGESGAIHGDVSLGGGDDWFWIDWTSGGGTGPTIGGNVAGGTGSDTLLLDVTGSRTIDLEGFTGFEILDAGTITGAVGEVRVIHANGFREFRNDYHGSLTLAHSASPDAVILPNVGTVLLESTATVGSIGAHVAGIEDVAQGDDTQSSLVTNQGMVMGGVRLGIGDDLYDARTGSTGGTIFGYAGNDRLYGGAEANRIEGGHGADRIEGNGGADILDGGAGADIFVYRALGDSTGAAADTILGFATGVDKIDLRLARASKVSWVETDGSSLVTVQTPTGVMKLNVEGAVALGDFLMPVGMILGTTANDTLTGTSAANIFDGGLGADTMTGKGGNDYYHVDNVGDRAVEASGGGVDTVESRVSYTIGAQVEKLVLGGSGAIGGTGNSLANTITGNAAANRLDGGLGADTLIGGKGNDLYIVDNAGDLLKEIAGEGTDSVQSSVSFSLNGANLETLTLTGSAAINGTGNGLANTITGNAAANRLDGGAGADVMKGGAGNDIYVVDNAADVVTESAGGGTDTVQSSVSFNLGGANLEKLTLTGTGNVNGIGNGLANTINGNGGANILDGGAGADALRGGAGNDSFRFATALGATNVDFILDFAPADDSFQLLRSVFAAAGPNGTLSASAFHQGTSAADAGDRILYDQATGKIFYDSDGTGAAAAMLFATVTPGTALTHADFIIYG